MTDDSEIGHSQAGALEAMLDASDDTDLARDFRSIVRAFEREDYETVIDIAWRHQFSSDRSHFKRDIRELQVDVSRRARKRLEDQR